MKKKKGMPMLSDILRMVDRNKVLSDLRGKYNHSVSYNNSRTIIKYIEEEEVLLTAYAYNPGNAIVIFPKKNALIAYSCYLEAFPSGESYSSFRWTKMKMVKAITLIKEDMWEDSNYIEDAVYEDTSYPNRWSEVAAGKLEYTHSTNSPLSIIDYKKAYIDNTYTRYYVIYRLTSGRLRVELDNSYYPFDDFTNIVLFYRGHKDDESVKIMEVPQMNSWQRVLSIDDPGDEILDQLKVQVISKKMKAA